MWVAVELHPYWAMVGQLLTSVDSSLLPFVENKWCLFSIIGRLLLDGPHVDSGEINSLLGDNKRCYSFIETLEQRQFHG